MGLYIHWSGICLLTSMSRFLPADALWNLAMAMNVYLTLFKKYNAQQLKALEWRYHLMCYGGPLSVAVVYLFIDTADRGKIYGPATVAMSCKHMPTSHQISNTIK